MNENCVIRWWPHCHKRRKWPPDRMGSDQFFNYELLKRSLNVVQVDSWVVGQWYWLKFERRAEQGKAKLADALRKRLVVFVSSFLSFFSSFKFLWQRSVEQDHSQTPTLGKSITPASCAAQLCVRLALVSLDCCFLFFTTILVPDSERMKG